MKGEYSYQLSAIGLPRLLFRIEIDFVCISESSDEGRVHNVWERWSDVTTIRMSSDANMDFPKMQNNKHTVKLQTFKSGSF